MAAKNKCRIPPGQSFPGVLPTTTFCPHESTTGRGIQEVRRVLETKTTPSPTLPCSQMQRNGVVHPGAAGATHPGRPADGRFRPPERHGRVVRLSGKPAPRHFPVRAASDQLVAHAVHVFTLCCSFGRGCSPTGCLAGGPICPDVGVLYVGFLVSLSLGVIFRGMVP